MSWSVSVSRKPRDEVIAEVEKQFESVRRNAFGSFKPDEIARGEEEIGKVVAVARGAEPQDLITVSASGSAWQSTTGRSMNRAEGYFISIEQEDPPVPELAPGAFTAAVI